MADENQDDVEALRERIRVLVDVVGEAYQFAGAVGAPERVLDNLAAAAEGRPLPHDSFLPIAAEECDEVRDRSERQGGMQQILTYEWVGQPFYMREAAAAAAPIWWTSTGAPWLLADSIGGALIAEQLLAATQSMQTLGCIRKRSPMPDEASTEPTQSVPQPVNKLVVERAENFNWLYANSTLIEGNAWDLKITFGQIDKIPDGSPGTLIKQQVAVTIPYAQAKLAVYWLQAQILSHELEAGTIAVRKDQYPPPPPPLTDEQRAIPSMQKFHELLVKLREEFVASLTLTPGA
jgi:hypothetical protein